MSEEKKHVVRVSDQVIDQIEALLIYLSKESDTEAVNPLNSTVPYLEDIIRQSSLTKQVPLATSLEGSLNGSRAFLADKIDQVFNNIIYDLQRQFPYRIYEYGEPVAFFGQNAETEAGMQWGIVRRSTDDPEAHLEVIDENGASRIYGVNESYGD